MDTCKNCKHYKKQMDANNVLADQGTCWQGPPTPIMIQQPGGVGMAMVRATVEGKTPSCGQFDSLVVLEIVD